MSTTTFLLLADDTFQRVRLLAGGFIAGYRSVHTRRKYAGDLRQWFEFCARFGIDPIEARRTYVSSCSLASEVRCNPCYRFEGHLRFQASEIQAGPPAIARTWTSHEGSAPSGVVALDRPRGKRVRRLAPDGQAQPAPGTGGGRTSPARCLGPAAVSP